MSETLTLQVRGMHCEKSFLTWDFPLISLPVAGF